VRAVPEEPELAEFFMLGVELILLNG